MERDYRYYTIEKKVYFDKWIVYGWYYHIPIIDGKIMYTGTNMGFRSDIIDKFTNLETAQTFYPAAEVIREFEDMEAEQKVINQCKRCGKEFDKLKLESYWGKESKIVTHGFCSGHCYATARKEH